MADGRVNKNVKIILSPGNDDRFVIDDVIKESERIIYPEEKVVEIDRDHEMISCCWSNPTPWNSPREVSEEELGKKLETEFKRVDSYDNLICNFHVPPYKSNLDLAPKLDKNMRVKYVMGKPEFVPVGSKSLQKLMKKYMPKLGLHGHVHESAGEKRYGRTLCVNPGSEYGEGILKGYLIDLTKEGIKRYWRVEG
jgi:Icc-related predicted phosphoesterase